VQRVREATQASERKVCATVSQNRATQRYTTSASAYSVLLRQAVVNYASEYGRYGYRAITDLLRMDGWGINYKRVERIWRQEGLKVPTKQRPRKRLWNNDGSCIRLRPEWKNHVWAYDFVQCRTANGKAFRVLVIIDEYSRECLALHVARSIRSLHVMHVLADLFLTHGMPDNLRSDNGPEFIAVALKRWLSNLGVQTQYIEPGSPWENGYCESFNGKLRDNLLDGEIFMTMKEAEIVIEHWRKHYNGRRPHRSLGGRPPAPLTIFAPPMGGAMGRLSPPQEFSAISVEKVSPPRVYH
jgi:transposase InsO family protein